MLLNTPRSCRGFTLIEVLVAIVILSVGLLGLAGLQVSGLRNNQEAYLRSQATIIAEDVFDRMRANRAAAQNGDYDTDFDETENGGGSVAAADLESWKQWLSIALPAGDGEIVVDNEGHAEVRVRRRERGPAEDGDESGDDNTQTITFDMESRI